MWQTLEAKAWFIGHFALWRLSMQKWAFGKGTCCAGRPHELMLCVEDDRER